jgi:hypothetical protein
VKDTEQVDVEHPLDPLGIDLQHRTVAGDAGIGHDDVDATEAFDGRGGGRLHGRQSRTSATTVSTRSSPPSWAASESSAAWSRSVRTSLAPLLRSR